MAYARSQGASLGGESGLGDSLPSQEHVWAVAGRHRRPDGRGVPLVARLWLRVEGTRAWLLDLEVEPRHRSSGWGAAALAAAEREATRRGAVELRLSVFADNTAARRLYERAGYQVVEELMSHRAPAARRPTAARFAQGGLSLRGRVPDTGPAVWEAWNGRVQVGRATASLVRRSDGRHAEDLRVDVSLLHRGRGLASAILTGVEAELAAAGVVRAAGLVVEPLEAGRALAEAAGWRLAAQQLRKPLPPR